MSCEEERLFSNYYFTTDCEWTGNYSHLALERILPTSAAARVLLRTYEWLAGLSPTNTTLRWGRRFPAETHSSTSSRASLRICRASFLPEMITASCLKNENVEDWRATMSLQRTPNLLLLWLTLNPNKNVKICLKKTSFFFYPVKQPRYPELTLGVEAAV